MLEWNIEGHTYNIETDPGVFSPGHIDPGTLAMLSLAGIRPGMKLLDLGCGCGTVGIYASGIVGPELVTMVDIEPAAVALSSSNMERNGYIGARISVSDGLSSVEDTDYDLILSNPPYHTDFAVARHFIEDGIRHLKQGGRMIMVTKRRAWYENKLRSVFGGVRVSEINGYFVFISEKRPRKASAPKKDGPGSSSGSGLSKKLQRKYSSGHRSHS